MSDRAPKEAAYRFLVQPDPWERATRDMLNRSSLEGLDETLLRQRRAFLRPDSLVIVVMLTDEDDAGVDPRSVGGQGWAFSSREFPGSKTFRGDPALGTTAPRATSACETNPLDPDCTSCGFATLCNPSDAACQKIKNDPACVSSAYLPPSEDQMTVRFFDMKRRFGLDPQFPISRYVAGFTSVAVPSQKEEHPVEGKVIGSYGALGSCTNPLFAASLPEHATDELCRLPRGPRPNDLVLFALIGGIPNHLVTTTPDWRALVGNDPDAYDLSGIDMHLLPSRQPRPGLPAPSAVPGDLGPDPIHGREWDTGGEDLQYSCTFELETPRVCENTDPGCDCANDAKPPLCTATTGEQVRGKAYPPHRELRVARGLGSRAVLGSICAARVHEQSPGDPLAWYRPTMNAIVARAKPLLGAP